MKTTAAPDIYPGTRALSVSCPVCAAEAGVECSTSSGRPVPGWLLHLDGFRERMPGIHSPRMAGVTLTDEDHAAWIARHGSPPPHWS